MVCGIMNAVCSRFLEEAGNLIENVAVRHSVRIVEARGVDECNEATIGGGPVMDTDLRRLGRDSMSDFDFLITGDEPDELFVA